MLRPHRAWEVGDEQGQTQLVCKALEGSEVIGYVVIDSTVRGRSRGGLRMAPDVDEGEVRGLARTMTLKYGFLGLPQGGAKAGLRGDPEASLAERRRRLAAFGRAVAPLLLSRVYLPDTDLGTDRADVRHMLESVGMRTKRRELGGSRSGYYTALTVFTAAKRTVAHIGLDLSGCSVAIEGFGKVGAALARLFAEANARVVAISTVRATIFDPRGLDVGRLSRLAADAGSRAVELYGDADVIERAALLELPVDLLCPCARHDSLRADNATRVRARIVCPGANNPVTTAAERVLFERGIWCLPDFVTNSGGVLGGTMEFASIRTTTIASFIDRDFGARLTWLLTEAARRGVTPREVAVRVARQRFDMVRRDTANPTPLRRALDGGLAAYHRGWIPGRLVAAASLPYFRKTLA
jgi:glutamate dehydrogenase (NAD(P)+)